MTRQETWGVILYDPQTDQFSARTHTEQKGTRLMPSTPLGVGWIITGSCNLGCRHCYGNQERLPQHLSDKNQLLRLVKRLTDAGVMRVVISGGEPLLHPKLFRVTDELRKHDIGTILGTNGSYITESNVENLAKFTRVEVSLDAHTQDLHDAIRPSRAQSGSSWQDTLKAISLCLRHRVRLRVLTTLNSFNQSAVPKIANRLAREGVQDWAMSPTINAGRARGRDELLKIDHAVVAEGVRKSEEAHPTMIIRYSDRSSNLNRYYCLILPDGTIATEDTKLGEKVIFGSLIDNPISDFWNSQNYNLEGHLRKWVPQVSYDS